MSAAPNGDERPVHDERPWGSYDILEDSAGYKVKRLVVRPRKRLSYQWHARRAEHWFIVSGEGTVTLEGEHRHLSAGDSIDVPRRSPHRIENTGSVDLVLIEVQHGDYFGEDDITRIEDDFGRVADRA